MSKKEKLVQRFLSRPKDFTWAELVSLLRIFGYRMSEGGKTGGSRVKFIHPNLPLISLHKPHPGNIVRQYQLGYIRDLLIGEGMINEK